MTVAFCSGFLFYDNFSYELLVSVNYRHEHFITFFNFVYYNSDTGVYENYF